jgi:hypothetical protein
MEQRIGCIYRKKKCFHICNKTAIKNTFYCCYHIHSKKKHLCKIFYNILEDRHCPTVQDIYKMYVYILETEDEDDDIFINILFIDLLKMMKIETLSAIYKDYSVATVAAKDIYAKIYELNKNTHLFRTRCNLNVLMGFQDIVRYKLLCRSDATISNYLNESDVFTMENIRDIHPRKLFTIKDVKGYYGFNIVELEYFVRGCISEGVVPYNPYTREEFDNKIIWRMNMKIKYSHIATKTDECRWTTDMNAYTDLSIEIERRGFYNNPEWFKKMPRHDFLKCIKLFRVFSSTIEESQQYFLNININATDANVADIAFTYAFCKEAIRLFRECNDDLYILCCNFMKSLAICSKDFYNNIPDWLSTFETPLFDSHQSSFVPDLSDFNTLIATLINNRNNMDTEIGSGSDILNTRIAYPPLPNPSNNFLLYYYVEYM